MHSTGCFASLAVMPAHEISVYTICLLQPRKNHPVRARPEKRFALFAMRSIPVGQFDQKEQTAR